MSYRLEDANALVQQGWEAEVWEESQEADIFEALQGTYSDDDKVLPDGIINRVVLNGGETKKTIPMILDLNGAGVQGAGKTMDLSTDVENFDMRYLTVYANDVRHAVGEDKFGLYAHRNSPYKLMERINAAEAKWLKARRGKHKRQALLELCSDNLEVAPTTLTTGWNPNMLVKNVLDGNQPVYDSSLSSFAGHIMAAMDEAGTDANALLDADFFTALEYYVTNVWKIQPMDNGMYICVIPSRQARYLKLLSSTESLLGLARGTFVESVAKLANQQILGVIGKLVLCVDDRAAIVDYDTNADTLTAYYRDVGNVDGRSGHVNTTTHKIFDVGYVIGKGGLTETMAMKPRYDDDLFNIGQRQVVSLSTTYGFQATRFDSDTPTAASNINQNSASFLAYSGAATV